MVVRQQARLGFAVTIALLPALAGIGAAQATTLHVLHDFCGKAGCPDGGPAFGGFVRDSAGNLFGAALGGPANGIVFDITDNKVTTSPYARIHAFCTGNCRDGAAPQFPLISDAAGNLYGTTLLGGTSNGGTVFRLAPKPGGTLEVLHAFCAGVDCTTGSLPASGLTYQGAAEGAPYDGQSPLFGTTTTGGTNNSGTVYALTLSSGKWRAKALHDFCAPAACPTGATPMGELVLDSAGDIFGIANLGGANDEGAVFELSPSGGHYRYAVIYSFCSQASCIDGIRPSAGLAIDSNGDLFGTTQRAGTHDAGTLFELSRNGKGFQYSVLYQFCGAPGCGDGAAPQGPLTLDGAGNLFGTTVSGGDFAAGTVFTFIRADGSNTEAVLYSFCKQQGCADGANPASPLLLDAAGDLFGTTLGGGAGNAGVAFELVR